jgi:hypothetical protein
LFTTFRLYDNLRFETRKKKKSLDLVEITFDHQFGRVKTREGRTIAKDTESKENCNRNRIKSNCNRHRIKRKLQQKQNQEQLQQKQNQELIGTETESRAICSKNRIETERRSQRERGYGVELSLSSLPFSV